MLHAAVVIYIYYHMVSVYHSLSSPLLMGNKIVSRFWAIKDNVAMNILVYLFHAHGSIIVTYIFPGK